MNNSLMLCNFHFVSVANITGWNSFEKEGRSFTYIKNWSGIRIEPMSFTNIVELNMMFPVY